MIIALDFYVCLHIYYVIGWYVFIVNGCDSSGLCHSAPLNFTVELNHLYEDRVLYLDL